MASKFLKGDTVIVLVGKDKGKISKIDNLFPLENKAILEGIKSVTKSVKHNKDNIDNVGFIKKSSFIDLSNVSHVTKNGLPSRVGFKFVNEKKKRFLKKTGEIIGS